MVGSINGFPQQIPNNQLQQTDQSGQQARIQQNQLNQQRSAETERPTERSRSGNQSQNQNNFQSQQFELIANGRQTLAELPDNLPRGSLVDISV